MMKPMEKQDLMDILNRDNLDPTLRTLTIAFGMSTGMLPETMADTPELKEHVEAIHQRKAAEERLKKSNEVLLKAFADFHRI